MDGHEVQVPANLGVNPAGGQMSAVHTHTSDGVIHIEAAHSGQVFTLGQLFTEWDVALGPGQLGAQRGTGTLSVIADGKAYPGDPALLRLAPDQRITLIYATTR